jgi:NAD+ kinase
MEKFYIFSNRSDEPRTSAVCSSLRAILGERNAADLAYCDIIIAVGGDGTILRCARTGKPVFGINTGRMGFLASTEIHPENLRSNVKRLLQGKYTVSERAMLKITYKDNVTLALNDVVFARPRGVSRARLPRFAIKRGHDTITDLRADGIIISTPTGSTAYNLSAGGAIIEPHLSCMQYVPICPHTLSFRPVILSPERVAVTYSEWHDADVRQSGYVYFSADGDPPVSIDLGETVYAEIADEPFKLLRTGDSDFFDTIAKKIRN